jgi:hypothetical protein
MKTRALTITLLGLAAIASLACTTPVYTEPGPEPEAVQPPPPAPEVRAEVSFFYDDLAPYGSWVTVAAYGDVWVPRVPPWWRPYTEGHWVYTDDGWAWASAEPWGWAACHYGRWYFDPEYGWAWVPGTVWAPAWVAWRSGGGHIGWAPLPPQARWEVGIGFSGRGIELDAVIAPQSWCFVEARYIGAPAIREVVLPPARNVTFVNITRNITNYTVINNRIVNNGVDVRRIEQVTRQPVPRYRIVDRDSPAALHGQPTQPDEIPMVRRVIPAQANATGQPAGTPRGGTVTGAGAHAGGEPVPARQGSGTAWPAQQHAQGRTVTETPATAARTVETPAEIQRRHRVEMQDLEAHHAAERSRLSEIHQAEQTQTPANATADQVRARHLAEQNSLEEQHRREAQLLAHRHEREVTGTAKPKDPPPPTPKTKTPEKPKRDGEENRH